MSFHLHNALVFPVGTSSSQRSVASSQHSASHHSVIPPGSTHGQTHGQMQSQTHGQMQSQATGGVQTRGSATDFTNPHSVGQGGSNQPPLSSSTRPQPVGYTNVPSTKRTMLRNDQMYEMYNGAGRNSHLPREAGQGSRTLENNSSGTPQSSRNSLGTSQPPIHSMPSTPSQSLDRRSNPNLVQTPTHQQQQQNRNSTHDLPRHGATTPSKYPQGPIPTPPRGGSTTPTSQRKNSTTPTPRGTTPERDVTANRTSGPDKDSGGNSGGSTDDEVWRAQLYQASVKLQKTPSDKRKHIQVGTNTSLFLDIFVR